MMGRRSITIIVIENTPSLSRLLIYAPCFSLLALHLTVIREGISLYLEKTLSELSLLLEKAIPSIWIYYPQMRFLLWV